MTVVPDEVISGVRAADLVTAMQSCDSPAGEIILSMPKFKIEYDFANVTNVMKELGVREIFIRDVGDYGNLFLEVGNHENRDFFAIILITLTHWNLSNYLGYRRCRRVLMWIPSSTKLSSKWTRKGPQLLPLLRSL